MTPSLVMTLYLDIPWVYCQRESNYEKYLAVTLPKIELLNGQLRERWRCQQ
jgi:hypothetical protein